MATTEIFLEKHGVDHFRHSDDLIPRIESGHCVLNDFPRSDGTGALASNLLSIYQLRAEVWQHLFGETVQHTVEDMWALCEELEKVPNDLVGFWGFKVKNAPASEYILFESLSSHRILGCIFLDGKAVRDSGE